MFYFVASMSCLCFLLTIILKNENFIYAGVVFALWMIPFAILEAS